MLQKLDKFHHTASGYLLFGLVEFALAYVFVSLSIDKGSLWYYLLTLIFFVGALRNLFGLLGTVFKRKPRLRA